MKESEAKKKIINRLLVLADSHIKSKNINKSTKLNIYFKNKVLRDSFLASINKRLGIKINLTNKQWSITLDCLADIVMEELLFSDNSEDNTLGHIKKASYKKYYPLTHAQKRMWLLYRLQPISPFYNISFARELSGGLMDVDVLKKSLKYVVDRHESLRTNFKEINGEPCQIIKNNLKPNIKIINLKSGKNIKEQKSKIDELIKKEVVKPFILEKDSLFRIIVIKTGEVGEKRNKIKYFFLVIMHHIISDAWSAGIFVKEISQAYNDLFEGKKVNLKKPIIQFKDYAVWERSKDNFKKIIKQEKYWQKKVEDNISLLDLPLDRPRPHLALRGGATERFILDKRTSEELKGLAKKTDTTMFNLLLAIFYVLLSRVTGQSDIAIGIASTDRNFIETEGVIGFFVNTLISRQKIDSSLGFNVLVNELKKELLKIYENKNYPFEKLVEKVNPARSINQLPFINAMFLYDPEKDYKLNLGKLKEKQIFFNNYINKFDIKMRATELKGKRILLSCEYNADIFKSKTIKRFLSFYRRIISDVLIYNKIKISKIDIFNKELVASNYRKVNKTNYPYLKTKSLDSIFFEQAIKTPNNIAVECEGDKITYKDLKKRVNKLSLLLKKDRFGKNSTICIMTERNIDLVVSLLACLKIGGISFMVDVGSPKERVKNLILGSKTDLVLCSKEGSAPPIGIKKININNVDIYIDKEDGFKGCNKPEDSVFIVHTSGSTGKQKSVVLGHQGIINNLTQRIIAAELTDRDTTCLNSYTEFISAPHHILMPLLVGAKLIVYSKEIIKDPYLLFKKINKDKVSVLEIGAYSLFLYLNEIDFKKNKKYPLTNLRVLMSSGAKTSVYTANSFIKNYKKKKFIVAYGCSEYSMSLNKVSPSKLSVGRVLEGKPTLNTEIYILDRDQNMLPSMLVGELYVSGEGIAKGYLHNKLKNKEFFLAHPFKKGKKIYRTGDLAKMHNDGNIEILGRIDHQIKINGFRIEPEEIELLLKKYKNIRQVLVRGWKKKQPSKRGIEMGIKSAHLLCYYTSVDGKRVNSLKIKAYLSGKLPGYMIPLYFVHLHEMPVNRNGKLDQNKLPEPREEDISKTRYISPQTRLEKQLAAIWRDVLKIKSVGMNDNFFDLGGHSFNAIILLSRINKQFSVNLILRDIFKYPVFRDLSQKLNEFLVANNINIIK